MNYLLTIFFGITMLAGMFLFGVMHEQVHSEIYRGYGIESEIFYFSEFPNMVTKAESPCPTEECELAHNINEVVGYSFQAFYLLIGVGFLVLIFLKERQIELKEMEMFDE